MPTSKKPKLPEVDVRTEPVIIVNLKDMDVEDIVETYSKHEVVLTEMFNNHKSRGHDYRFHSHFRQFITILDELLDERQMGKMYIKIRTELDSQSVNDVTSNVR